MTEIETLQQSIQLHHSLYTAGKPLISDAQYDDMVRQLHLLQGGKPNDPVAPPLVGSVPATSKGQVAHPAPMLSLNNADTEDQRAEAWLSMRRQVQDIEAYADLKIDGMALRLEYQDGQLVGACTRGDGHIGEDVFANALRVADVPYNLPDEAKGSFSVLGEAYMTNTHFILLNADREEAGEQPYSNPRNTVAGGMRHSDPNEVLKRGIRFLAYGIMGEGVLRDFKHHNSIMLWLTTLGFKVAPYYLGGIITLEHLELAYERLSQQATKQDYDCDGVVIKVNDLAHRDTLGLGRTAPKWAVACKFPPKGARTRLLDVQFSVGRTGAVTPVGIVQPVLVGDVTVSKMSLHNSSIIENLDLRIGDNILVKRAGDVIPAVDTVYTKERNGTERPVVFPNICPECNTTLISPPAEARIYCPNTLLCPGQLRRALEHYAGRDYMNLQGVGPAVIDQLVEHKLVEEVADLYRLTKDDLMRLDGFGQRKTEKLLEEIQKSKLQPLNRLIAALGIREVGRTASLKLLERFSTLEELMNATYEQVRDVDTFGPTMSESYCQYMNNSNNREQLLELQRLGVGTAVHTQQLHDTQTDDQHRPLAGKRVCVTGKLTHISRGEANRLVEQMGGVAQGSVSSKTDLLVVGESPGSKLQKAQHLGVEVISEFAFRSLCAGD